MELLINCTAGCQSLFFVVYMKEKVKLIALDSLFRITLCLINNFRKYSINCVDTHVTYTYQRSGVN